MPQEAAIDFRQHARNLATHYQNVSGSKRPRIVIHRRMVAKYDYDSYRFLTTAKGEKRKNKAIELNQKIKKLAQEIESLIYELEALGYRSQRNDDANLGANGIHEALGNLIDKTDRFKPNYVCEEGFINAAITSQKLDYPKTEYLRGFIFKLREMGFNPSASDGWIEIIVDMVNAALTDGDDPVIYNDVWIILSE